MAGKNVTDYYAYTASFGTIAAAASSDKTINIQSDSAFVARKMMFSCDLGATLTNASRVVPLMTIQVTDTGSGRNMFDQAVPLAAVAGNGELPFLLPEPKLFKPNSDIVVTLSNISGDNYQNVHVVFAGAKVFSLS